jgi:hypothetical protein
MIKYARHLRLYRQLTLALLLFASSRLQADNHQTEALEAAATRAELTHYLTEDDAGRAVSQFIQQQMPAEIKDFFDGMLQRDPELAEEMLEHLTEICEEYKLLQQEAPAEAALFVKIERHEVLSHVLSESFEPQSPQAKAIARKIRSELEAAFDLKLQWQAQELKQLQDEVEDLSALLEQRKQAREAIIQRRLDELTGINSHLEW